MLDIVALSILLIVFAAIVNYVRASYLRAGRPNNKYPGASGKDQDANKYHAVAIAKQSVTCGMAAQLVGRRYLSKEAPLLPLSGCTAKPCRCRYVHYADRRSEERRFPFGVRRSSEPSVANIERRSSERRKAADFAMS